jgi:hypothetical protein
MEMIIKCTMDDETLTETAKEMGCTKEGFIKIFKTLLDNCDKDDIFEVFGQNTEIFDKVECEIK